MALVIIYFYLELKLNEIVYDKIWANCTKLEFDSCSKAEKQLIESMFYFEIRAVLMGLFTFLFTYFMFRDFNKELIKSVAISLTLSLIWIPAVWLSWGMLRPHTLDAAALMIAGGFLAVWLIQRKHITSRPCGTV